jgi:hypothetical protein
VVDLDAGAVDDALASASVASSPSTACPAMCPAGPSAAFRSPWGRHDFDDSGNSGDLVGLPITRYERRAPHAVPMRWPDGRCCTLTPAIFRGGRRAGPVPSDLPLLASSPSVATVNYRLDADRTAGTTSSRNSRTDVRTVSTSSEPHAKAPAK